MGRKREVLSVTVTEECMTLLTKFVEQQCENGWATNKSMVVNNAIIDFINRAAKNNTSSIPALAPIDKK